MNYAGFTMPLWYWLGGFKFSLGHGRESIQPRGDFGTGALVDSWQAYRASVPWQIVRQQFNALGTHDTPRIRAIFGNDLVKVRLAVSLLMTVPGVPCLFYGDEIGLAGSGNDSRVCMPWDKSAWDHSLLEDYRQLIHLRKTSPALIEGGFQVLAVEQDLFAFLRDAEEEQIIVIANRAAAVHPADGISVSHGGIEDGAAFDELLTGRHAVVEQGRLPLPELPTGASIWIRKLL